MFELDVAGCPQDCFLTPVNLAVIATLGQRRGELDDDCLGGAMGRAFRPVPLQTGELIPIYTVVIAMTALPKGAFCAARLLAFENRARIRGWW